MLSEPELRVINMVAPAALATAAGIAAWNRPGWAFLPLLGLAFSLRPIFGGSVVPLLRVGKERGPSDAEHNFIFPPNRRPRERIRLLTRALAEPTTWARIAYGIAWTMAILCWGVRLGGTPPWTLSFWQNNGLRLAVAVGGSLLLVLAAYLARETFMAARDDARARRRAIALWRRRWFRGKNLALDEPYRLKLMAATQIFSGFLPFEREEIARTMVPERCGPWRALNAKGAIPAKVSLIVSGKVGLRRETASGRTVAVQVLTEGDVVGLSDLADPGGPRYQARTLTPVTLLTLQRADAERLISQKIPPTTLADFLLKAPFLRQIPLCRNWHLQAVNRFSRLSVIRSFPPGDTIMSEGQTVEDFFIIFQGDAKVSQRERKVSTIRAGEFFGEIGLMQNSCPIASVTAHLGTRCLSIPRKELLRFVTHNYTVALELEHVSSKRLGRPLFPLRAGDFRGI
jgi:CRP-like cAMP-binding protein